MVFSMNREARLKNIDKWRTLAARGLLSPSEFAGIMEILTPDLVDEVLSSLPAELVEGIRQRLDDLPNQPPPPTQSGGIKLWLEVSPETVDAIRNWLAK